jgi:hypothetical protein
MMGVLEDESVATVIPESNTVSEQTGTFNCYQSIL